VNEAKSLLKDAVKEFGEEGPKYERRLAELKAVE